MVPYKEIFHAYVQQNSQAMIGMLKELVSFRSDRGEALSGMPFGECSAKMLERVHQLYRENGFSSKTHIEKGYALAYYGEGEKSIGLFAHADVVSAGNDWLFTQPYEPLEKDGILIGRGVLDDKSAVVISLWCAKMFRELNIPLKSKLVLFTGGCEETGMLDMANFVAENPMPDFSLVCDTAFPIYIGDKGGVIMECEGILPLECISAFEGGKSANVTLGQVRVVLPMQENLKQEIEQRLNERITLTCSDSEMILTAKGISTHGALPEGSLNAAWLVAEVLRNCPSLPENDREQMARLSLILGDYYAVPLGIAAEDEHFGHLTCTNGAVFMREKKLHFLLDIRHGDTVQQAQMLDTLSQSLERMGYRICGISKKSTAWRLDEKLPIIQEINGIYQEYTGDHGEIRYNAGGTYARQLKNAIEVGTTTKWNTPFAFPVGHGGAHQPDEKLNLEGFLEAFEIIASMVAEADRILNIE